MKKMGNTTQKKVELTAEQRQIIVNRLIQIVKSGSPSLALRASIRLINLELASNFTTTTNGESTNDR